MIDMNIKDIWRFARYLKIDSLVKLLEELKEIYHFFHIQTSFLLKFNQLNTYKPYSEILLVL